jgi:uncharacterized glyoxalase superfamily protein PhnB
MGERGMIDIRLGDGVGEIERLFENLRERGANASTPVTNILLSVKGFVVTDPDGVRENDIATRMR